MKIRREDITAQFGMKLYDIAKKRGIEGAPAIAEALYENDVCYKIIKPGGRDKKYLTYRNKDIAAISKQVQRHFDCEEAYEVGSDYLYAYSKLFNCSIDYFFGLISQDCPNADTNDIAEKTGLSGKAVANLIQSKDEDSDASYSRTKWWSDIPSDDAFDSIPAAWMMYCMQVQEYNDLEKKIKAIEAAEKSANDQSYRLMMQARREALEKMQPGKSSDCDGAFRILSKLTSDYYDKKIEEWLSTHHVDIEQNYYDNEIKRIEILENALKDGAKPVSKNK